MGGGDKRSHPLVYHAGASYYIRKNKKIEPKGSHGPMASYIRHWSSETNRNDTLFRFLNYRYNSYEDIVCSLKSARTHAHTHARTHITQSELTVNSALS